MSLGFTCPKSEGNYGTWYQWSVNKCLDTGVRITLVWVTGDPHPQIDMTVTEVRPNVRSDTMKPKLFGIQI